MSGICEHRYGSCKCEIHKEKSCIYCGYELDCPFYKDTPEPEQKEDNISEPMTFPICDCCEMPVDEYDAGGVEFYYCRECTNEISPNDIEYGTFIIKNGNYIRINDDDINEN